MKRGLGNDDIPTKGGRSKKKQRFTDIGGGFSLYSTSHGTHGIDSERIWETTSIYRAASESDVGRSAACVLLSFFQYLDLALYAPVSKSELLGPVLLCTSA